MERPINIQKQLIKLNISFHVVLGKLVGPATPERGPHIVTRPGADKLKPFIFRLIEKDY